MTRIQGSVVALCGALIVGVLGVALAADEKAKTAAPQMPPDMAEWMKYAQPGEHHKHMAKMVGTWKAHTKSWMAPGAPPEESDGTMTVTAVLDGRFFESVFKGTIMGQTFEGIGLDGYDMFKQKHVGTWADTMGTMILQFEGTCSDGGKRSEMRATFDDPMTKKRSYMRSVNTWKDEKTVVMESYSPGPDGKEIKNMEITFTRM